MAGSPFLHTQHLACVTDPCAMELVRNTSAEIEALRLAKYQMRNLARWSPFFLFFFSIKINQESQGRCQCVHLVWVWDPRGGTPTCVRPGRCGVLCFWAHRGSHVHRRLRVEIHCQRLTLSLLRENRRMLLAEESHRKFQAGLGVVYRHLKRTGERTSMRF